MAEQTGERTTAQIAEWIREHDITSVRCEATNLDGTLVGKILSPTNFLGKIERGVTFSDNAFAEDLGNAPQLGFDWPAWRGEFSDILLVPDLDTLVEWAPGRATVLGDFTTTRGERLGVDPRGTLRTVVERLAAEGYRALCSVEVEATVFEEPIQEARRRNYRGLTPLGGTSGAHFVVARSTDLDDYMTAVVTRLEAIGVPWEGWNDEAAAGQVEINIAPADPVSAADHWARTRQVMREVANEQGRTVTFMAKWSEQYGQASHLNLSLTRDGRNAFHDGDGPSSVLRNFLAGLMETLPAATSFSLPFITSYRRLTDFEGPPTTVTWGQGNKTCAVRVIADGPQRTRLEYRLPGADSNVYLTLAAVIAGGLAGLQRGLEPPDPFENVAWLLPAGTVARIPDSITRSAQALRADNTLVEYLGAELVEYWLGTRRWEWMSFHTGGGDPEAAFTQWELDRYFELV